MIFRDEDIHGRLLFLEAREAERSGAKSLPKGAEALIRHIAENYDGMATELFNAIRPQCEEVSKTDPEMRAKLDALDAVQRKHEIAESRKQNIKVIK